MLALLALLCAVLSLISAALCVKIYLLHRSAEEINSKFRYSVESDTNALITIPSRDRRMRELASGLNGSLLALRRAENRYRRGDEELRSTLAGLSHDLRTPLTAIYGYLSLMEAEEMSENASRFAAIIGERARRLGELVDELFRYSLLLMPEKPPELETVDIKAELERSAAGFYSLFKDRGIEPVITMPDGRVLCRAEKGAAARIFSNLLSNAVKYSDGDLSATIYENGEICFENSASALDEVDVGRLFDRYYSVSAARSSTGLGLAVAKTLAERSGGRIWAEYKNGRLKITLSLPKV